MTLVLPKRERAIFRAFFIAFVLILAAASETVVATVHVVTTTTDLKSFVEYVGGDKIRVTSIVPAGAEAEEYLVKPQDLDRCGDGCEKHREEDRSREVAQGWSG